MSVEWTSEDKMHIAFMGPPLRPILATCFCGEVKRFDPEEIKVMAEKLRGMRFH